MTALSSPADAESVFTGARRVLVVTDPGVTDPGVAATGSPQWIAAQMAGFGIAARVFDGTHVEPTVESLEKAITFARDLGPWDTFFAVGYDEGDIPDLVDGTMKQQRLATAPKPVTEDDVAEVYRGSIGLW
jgi:alcohol dehydrogenase class IV